MPQKSERRVAEFVVATAVETGGEQRQVERVASGQLLVVRMDASASTCTLCSIADTESVTSSLLALASCTTIPVCLNGAKPSRKSRPRSDPAEAGVLRTDLPDC